MRSSNDAVVQVRLFGGVAAVGDDGEPVDVGPPKCQAVLASLALSPGSAVPVPRLVELVWGDQPPRTAEKTLQSYVTRLRKGLGHERIVRAGAAYRLDVEASAVDVARFERAVAAGDVDGALAEWQGTPLAGLDPAGLTPTVDGLVEQWLGALEIDLERRVEADASAAVGTLTELTASYPFREGLWALLMRALYRAGRQADALAAYRRARQHLVEGLGVEPGPQLRELEALVLAQDAELGFHRSDASTASGRPTGTVTFGFADLDGAARLWSSHRQEAALALARHDELVRDAVAAHAGHVFAAGSDSFGVAFHRAADAVAWALDLHAAMASEPWPRDAPLRVRVGLHTGETEEAGQAYFGAAVDVAARLAAAGSAGQTLVSGVTSALADRNDLVDLGSFRLDGLVAEQRISQVGSRAYPPLRTDASRDGNLPRRLGRLIGRSDDVQLVAAELTASPVVTLVGPGGIGKTRLALAVARLAAADLPSGAWLIELAGITASSDVPRAVADALDVKESSTRTLTQSIAAALRSQRAVLVLDNCEHVIDGAAALAQAIADNSPDVCILATSREGLGLADERLIPVAPLEPAGAALELFNERAAAISPTFDPHASRQEVEEICRRLDGVPLAIELAAARTRTLSPADLVERLDDRLRLLTGGRRGSVERHRTLRATIQWSYDLLTPLERTLFQRLSVFAGPFGLNAAETVAADADVDALAVDHLLGGLVDRSMLAVESGRFGRRFRLLETMRQFAAEHLSETGETDRVAGRLAAWCLGELGGIHDLLIGRGEVEGVARLAELWPNLRAAFDWACDTHDHELAHALVRPIVSELSIRNQSEIGDWAERILDISPPDDTELVAFWVTFAAHRYMQNQDHAAYERLIERYGEPDHPLVHHARAFVYDDDEGLARWGPPAVAELQRQGDDYLAEMFELAGRAGALMATGQFNEHDALVGRLADKYRTQGPPTFLNWTLFMLGYSASAQGRTEDAERYFDESLAVDVPDRTISVNEPIEARGAFRRGDHRRAYGILLAYIQELVETESVIVARLAGVEFINMMAAVDRLADAACVLGYLETRGEFGALSLRTAVADTTAAVESQPSLDDERSRGRKLDDRGALDFMGAVLEELQAP